MTRQTYEWGEMEWLASAEVGNTTSVSVARMRVIPGGISERHRHSNCDEVMFVQDGQLLLELEGSSIVRDPGEFVVVPIGAGHQVRNDGPQDLLLVLSYGAGRRVYEAC